MIINYTAPPTCARFMKSEAFIRLIAGPVGSGKTTAIIHEMLRRSIEQHKAPDGLRYTRWAICRQTLTQLKATVLKDILSWLGKLAEWKVSENTIYIRFGDVRSEWLLIPMEEPEDQRRLLSSQLTGAWISEGIEIDADLVAPIAGRCGRYPGANLGGASWAGVLIDTNMPTEGTPWHTIMAVDTPPEWHILVQPGGMDPNAENLEWLNQTPETLKLSPGDPARLAQGRVYYTRQLHGNNPDWVKRYIHAQYGNDPSGTAVFRGTFKTQTEDGRPWHVVDSIEPIVSRPLIIGQDFGRDPCAVIGQLDHMGRLLILGEVNSHEIGLELHIQMSLKPALMMPRYMGMMIMMVGDPSGANRDTLYEETCFDLLKKSGFNAYPAPTNNIDARLRACEGFFMGARGAGPAIIIDRSNCPQLIRALNGGYRFAYTRQGISKPLPEKNEFSHIADAFQYLCLACHGGLTNMLSTRLTRQRSTTATTPPPSAMGWT